MKRMQRANQRTKQTIDSGIYWDYLYVDAGQLYSAQGYTSGGSPITSWNRGYRYDPSWNMTARTNHTTPLSDTVNNLNQVTNSPVGDHTFNGNGNMTAEAPGTSTARPSSTLYYYGYRFYNPYLQRWLNRDPIGELGGQNLYRFSGNNPVGLTDAFGLFVLPVMCPETCPCTVNCGPAAVTSPPSAIPDFTGIIVVRVSYSCTDCLGNSFTVAWDKAIFPIIGPPVKTFYSYTKYVNCDLLRPQA